MASAVLGRAVLGQAVLGHIDIAAPPAPGVLSIVKGLFLKSKIGFRMSTPPLGAWNPSLAVTQDTTLAFGPFSTSGFLWLHNLDPSQAVTLKTQVGGQAVGSVAPGDDKVFVLALLGTSQPVLSVPVSASVEYAVWS